MENGEPVKNLVISGGCVGGFIFYGCLKKLNLNNEWNIENIENIYTCSVGSIVGLMIALKYDWKELDDFLIQRPWHKILKMDVSEMFNMVNNMGLYNVKLFHDAFDPLLYGKGLDPNITIKEFYEYSGICLHIIATKVNTMEMIDINYKTHPDFPLIDAVYCSSAIPIAFSPYYFDNIYLCDGGFHCNYPIDYCLQECKADETIGVSLDQNLQEMGEPDDKNGLNLFNYLLTLTLNMSKSINKKASTEKLRREIFIDGNHTCVQNTCDAIFEKESREKLVKIGMDYVS